MYTYIYMYINTHSIERKETGERERERERARERQRERKRQIEQREGQRERERGLEMQTERDSKTERERARQREKKRKPRTNKHASSPGNWQLRMTPVAGFPGHTVPGASGSTTVLPCWWCSGLAWRSRRVFMNPRLRRVLAVMLLRRNRHVCKYI